MIILDSQSGPFVVTRILVRERQESERSEKEEWRGNRGQSDAATSQGS